MEDSCRYYGLGGDPFRKGNPGHKPFLSQDHKEAVGMLDQAKLSRELTVLTAAPGMGKSYALHTFCRKLDAKKYETHYLCLSTVTVPEFYREICRTFGLDVRYGRSTMYRAFKDRIDTLNRNHYCPILIIDEAQELRSDVLRELKSLLNFKMDTENAFLLVLAGEPSLNTTLRKGIYDSLYQRVRFHYNFHGLSPEETEAYVRDKIIQSGGSDTIITPAGMEAVIGTGRGTPRIIDQIMSYALDLGYQEKRTVLDADIIMAASSARELCG